MKLRLATFNVHSFSDAKGRSSWERIKELIREHEPDIVCMQESGRRSETIYSEMGKFFSIQGFARKNGCSVLSKIKLKQADFGTYSRSKRGRFVTVLLDLADSGMVLELTNLHLSHKYETTRMREMSEIKATLEWWRAKQPEGSRNEEKIVKIWTGDFNSLTLSDYMEAELEEISRIRKNNRWESPVSEITDTIKDWGFKDAKEMSSSSLKGPLSTCRFNTRIDYFFVHDSGPSCQVLDIIHVDDTASDHNMVIVDLAIGEEESTSIVEATL